MRVNLKHSQSNLIKQCKIGFSWTTLFFGPFPALFRGDLKWFAINLILALCTFGISNLIFCFIYNNLYVKTLLEKGYIPSDDFSRSSLQAKGFVFSSQPSDGSATSSGTYTKQPLSTGTKVAIGVLVMVVLAIIGSIANKKNSVSTSNSTPSPAESSQVISAKIGDVVEVANFVYRVEDIAFRKSIGNEYVNKSADGIFLLVKLSLKNVDKEEHTLDNSLFKLVDASGTEYETSSEGSTSLEMSGVETLFLKSCNPNIQKVGYLVFEVPAKDTYHLKVSGGFWSGKTGDILLTKSGESGKLKK